MSYLRTKSQENFEAGLELLAISKYNASIHCFYYSCIQLMIDILIETLKLTQENINQEWNNSHRGFHNWLINFIIRKNILTENNIREFNNKILYLKKMRVLADYKQDKISKQIGLKVNRFSKEVLELLKKEIIL